MSRLGPVCVLAVLVTCVLYMQTVNALKCYDCKGCNDDFNSTGIDIVEDCIGSCAKLKTSSTVERLCSPTKRETKCKSEKHHGEDAEVCMCSSDLCNDASRPFVVMTTVFMTVLAAWAGRLLHCDA